MKLHAPRAMTTLVCAVAASAALGATAFAAPHGGRHHRQGIAAAWAAAWNGTEPEALGDLFTARATYTDQAIGVTLHGRKEIAGWKTRTNSLIENAHVTVHATHRAGQHLTIEAVYSGHLKGAPKPFAVPMATLLELHGHHLIASDQDYYSLNQVLAQSGLPADWTPPAA
ncbi:nuclear transport factor 2 family protein [Streptomyces montanisoli]|uniref:Nuclear transport factor 2 family protein n=1 Tax=Streptomyces montanisoli TaxID=2798581 RepID=A0A940MIL5_9ACTN|nr:nuclear transport factor 2 family protein [Streptomyces montanisoli]MBP0460362.1 nuclear transport factor 2 family protein [Streptomyces montanisoli]